MTLTIKCSLTCTLLLGAVASAQPWTRPLSDAADAVEDAYDRTQRSTGACRTQVGSGLNDLVDRIDALRRQADAMQLNQLRFELSTVAQQAPFAACPIGVTEDLQKALESLEDARVAMWSDPSRRGDNGGGGNRRDNRRRNGRSQPPPPVMPFVQIGAIAVQNNVVHQGESAVQLSLPEVRFEQMQGQGFYIATRFRSFEGDWSDWVATQVWTVPSSPFIWRNAYNHLLRYSTLAEENFSNGRFIAHIAVFNAQGQELAFRETTFRPNLPRPQVPVVPAPPSPPMVQRDCGTGPNDPGCLMVRDGRFPMDAVTYQGHLVSLRANNNEVIRSQMTEVMVRNNSMTAAQLSSFLDLFMNEVIRLDFARSAAPKVVNPQHAIGLSTKFRNSIFQSNYVQAMARQTPGVMWQPGMVGAGGIVLQPTVIVQQPGVPQPAVILPAVIPNQPVAQPVFVARDCGTGANDPGCNLTRNGVMAMDAQVFGGLMASLRGVSSEFSRKDMFDRVIARNGVTAQQLGQVMDLFSSEFNKLDVAKAAAPKCTNPQHALGLSTKFSSTFNAQEFVEVYSGQH